MPRTPPLCGAHLVEDAHPLGDLARRAAQIDRLAAGPGCGCPLDDGRGESVVAQPVGERGAGDAGAGDQYGVHAYIVHRCTAWSIT
jgi:hypothetical protein